MNTDFLIYGAYGYTGELIAELAVKQAFRPTLAGRNPEKTRKVAERLALPFLVFDLAETQKLDAALAQVKAVLHVAGPFSATAEAMVKACLRNKVHYLDVTGEIDVFEWIATQDALAKEAGIVLIPGVGFDVVPSDCLVAYLKNQLPDATVLELAINGLNESSRGTMLTMVEAMNKPSRIRENGLLKFVPFGYRPIQVEFDGKPVSVLSMPWGDVSTAFYSTQIPNIYVYFHMRASQQLMLKFAKYFGWMTGFSPIQQFLKWQVRQFITGPNEQTRNTSHGHIWGRVSNAKNEYKIAKLQTPEPYQLTAATALSSVIKVLKGEVSPGFKTPSLAFGQDFILEFEGVKRE
jgi:short subunit dehydrogenase-like uncharacterized protein